MRRFFNMIMLLNAVLFFSPKAAHADDQVPLTILRDEQIHNVAENGSASTTYTIENLIGSNAGITEAGQRYIEYDKAFEHVEVTDAYVLSKQGTRTTVLPEAIRDVQTPRSFAAPMFADIMYKVVIFPNLEIGSKTVLTFKKTQSAAVVPGYFSDLTTSGSAPADNVRIVYVLPRRLILRADNRGYQEIPVKDRGDQHIYEWNFNQAAAPRIERGSISAIDYRPRLFVSTYPDYAHLASAYNERAFEKAQPTEAIRTLAATIIGDSSTEASRTKALYDWVRTNIRYVAIYLGSGAIVPHSASEVLENRYGDCKDHVVLLEALLKSVGIKSEGALLNSGSSYSLPSVASFEALNHIITYVPTLDLYLDSTSPGTEYGFLPQSVLDKPTVMVGDGSMRHTPAVQGSASRSSVNLALSSDGAQASLKTNVRIEGEAAEANRYKFRVMSTQTLSQVVPRLLRDNQLMGTGSISTSAVKADGGPFDIFIKGDVQGVGSAGRVVTLPVVTSLTGGVGSYTARILSEGERTEPFACGALKSDEEESIELPAGFSLVSLPEGRDVQNKNLSYHSTYDMDLMARQVRISRHFNAHPGRGFCSVLDYQHDEPLLREIDNELKTQVLLRRGS